MSNAVAMNNPQTSVVAMTPMDMMNKAVAQGASIEILEKLMSLNERWESSQARKAFDEAMSAAKAEIPVILKNRTVDFTSQKGRTHYRHEDLAEIARTVTPILGKHGLSYRFRTSSAAGEPVVVTCIVSHRGGHFEENTLSGGRDESGNKNSLQAVGSTLTYLQRMTLKAALGLAASDDDDGVASSGGVKVVTQAQADNLRDLIESVNADHGRFLEWLSVESLEAVPAARYAEAVSRLNDKRGKK